MPNTLTSERARYLQSLSAKNRRSGKYIKCTVCGSETYRYPSQVKKNYRYCSKKCWYAIMEVSPSQIMALHKNRSKRDYSNTMARKKLGESIKKAYKEGRLKPRYGSDNNLWKGGIASLQNSLRQTSVYKEWRKQVYERDNYSCQKCGTNKDLHAHHIKEFSKYPDLRYEVSNGLTVCRTCHGKIHGRYLPNISKANVINKE